MPLYLIDWTLNTILHREEICTAGRGEKSEASDNWKTQNTNNMKKKSDTNSNHSHCQCYYQIISPTPTLIIFRIIKVEELNGQIAALWQFG